MLPTGNLPLHCPEETPQKLRTYEFCDKPTGSTTTAFEIKCQGNTCSNKESEDKCRSYKWKIMDVLNAVV
jgi:hypothetical protein